MDEKHWSLEKYTKKLKSVDIVKRKSNEPPVIIPEEKYENIERSPKIIGTPEKKILPLTPGKMMKIKGSPKSKRYLSVRSLKF